MLKIELILQVDREARDDAARLEIKILKEMRDAGVDRLPPFTLQTRGESGQTAMITYRIEVVDREFGLPSRAELYQLVVLPISDQLVGLGGRVLHGGPRFVPMPVRWDAVHHEATRLAIFQVLLGDADEKPIQRVLN